MTHLVLVHFFFQLSTKTIMYYFSLSVISCLTISAGEELISLQNYTDAASQKRLIV